MTRQTRYLTQKTVRFCRLLPALAALTLSAGVLHAQENFDDAPDDTVAAAPAIETAALRVIEAANLATLRTLRANSPVRAVSLGVSRTELTADTAALGALRAWVRGGGVVFLHTDAAQLFGYSTVPVREGTARVAGQLFGRARASLAFGAHPLLWGSVRPAGAANNTNTNDETGPAVVGATAVRVVYYQAQPGDQFVTEHPSGVPLLTVT
ncbi:MAG TPA: hypothetical protein VF719_06945, partial [Abditibacteriaceae bacterium]